MASAVLGMAAACCATGCRNGWDTNQIQDHLTSDFYEDMPRSVVEAKLAAYPKSKVTHPDSEFTESRWPTPSEWAAKFDASYEPWTVREDRLPKLATGPVVISTQLRIRTTPMMSFPPLIGGSAAYVPHPYSVWFVFNDNNALTHWGHSVGTTHFLYPEETAE